MKKGNRSALPRQGGQPTRDYFEAYKQLYSAPKSTARPIAPQRPHRYGRSGR